MYLHVCVNQCQLLELPLNWCKELVVANMSVVQDINQVHTMPNRWTQFTVCISYFLGKKRLWMSAQGPGAPHWLTGLTSQHFPHWHIAIYFTLGRKPHPKKDAERTENFLWKQHCLYSSSVPSPALAETPHRSFPFCCPFLIISRGNDSIYSAWLLAVLSAVQ